MIPSLADGNAAGDRDAFAEAPVDAQQVALVRELRRLRR